MRPLTAVMAFMIVFPSALPGFAQIGNPAGMAPGTPQSGPGVPAPHTANTTDRLFAHIATIGGLAEVELAMSAEQRSQNGAVKAFAQHMIQDHRKANERLANLAKQAGIVLPEELDPEHKGMRTTLEQLSGPQFDVAYMRGQIIEHQKTVQLFEWEISSGQDADLQRFASETLPAIFAHLQMAQDLVAQIAGQVPQGAAPRATLTDGGKAHRAQVAVEL